MTYRIEIDTSNSAFDNAPMHEVARILRELATYLEESEYATDQPLRDADGRRVGRAGLGGHPVRHRRAASRYKSNKRINAMGRSCF
jgi:hypothetical protein